MTEDDVLEVGGRDVHDLGDVLESASCNELRIRDTTQLDTLTGLNRVAGVQRLTIVNAPRIRSLDPIADLLDLRSFGFRILMSKTSSQRIDSLGPLAALQHLESIEMLGVVAIDGSLQPLRGLRRLRHVHIPNRYDVAEFGQLAGALPEAKGFGLEPVSGLGSISCPKCEGGTEVQLIGRRRNRFVCTVCDADVIAKHRATFDQWRAVGASEVGH